MSLFQHPCLRHWSWFRTIPSSATSCPAGSTAVTTLSDLCGQLGLRFAPSAYLLPVAMPPTAPNENDQPFTPASSKLPWKTPASSSVRQFITFVDQSSEIRIPLGPRRPFQVRHYHSDHQRRSQSKHRCCLRCQPARFPECLRICVLPPFHSLNDNRMLSDIRK